MFTVYNPWPLFIGPPSFVGWPSQTLPTDPCPPSLNDKSIVNSANDLICYSSLLFSLHLGMDKIETYWVFHYLWISHKYFSLH